jgi:hypothetical protein
MKRSLFSLTALTLCWCAFLISSSNSGAQSAQSAQKLDQLAIALQLTPKQKVQLAPILKAEAPKVQAIESDPSLTGPQKLELLKAIHQETDPQVQAILTPQQDDQWQAIRRKELQQAIEKRREQ